jgi:transcriptional regulator with XRE-family HTH domain
MNRTPKNPSSKAITMRGADGAARSPQLGFHLMTGKRSVPTPADIEASRKIKAIWLRRGKRPKQDEIGALWSDRGITQGAVSQYMNGKVPVGLEAVLKFAQILECDPREIRSDLPGLDDVSYNPAPSALPLPSDEELDAELAGFPREVKAALVMCVRTARKLAQTDSASPAHRFSIAGAIEGRKRRLKERSSRRKPRHDD